MKKPPSLKSSYNKVITTIESCKTKPQLEGASNIVKNFKTFDNSSDNC